MKAKEYNDLFAKLEIRPRSQQAANLLGVCLRSTFMYSNGERVVPPPVAKLLRLVVATQNGAGKPFIKEALD